MLVIQDCRRWNVVARICRAVPFLVLGIKNFFWSEWSKRWYCEVKKSKKSASTLVSFFDCVHSFFCLLPPVLFHLEENKCQSMMVWFILYTMKYIASLYSTWNWEHYSMYQYDVLYIGLLSMMLYDCRSSLLVCPSLQGGVKICAFLSWEYLTSWWKEEIGKKKKDLLMRQHTDTKARIFSLPYIPTST